jgi:hypothetical protein
MLISFYIEINCSCVTLIFNAVTLSLLTFCLFLKMNISLISLLTHHPSTQMEIINKHNDLRRMTNPSASNMLKMVSCVFSKDYCQSAFSYLKIDFKIGPIFLKYSNLFILIESSHLSVHAGSKIKHHAFELEKCIDY